jgi:hypothetical protein
MRFFGSYSRKIASHLAMATRSSFPDRVRLRPRADAHDHREIAPASCARHAEDRGRREEGSRKKDCRQQSETQLAQEQACGRPRRTAGRRPVNGRRHDRDKHERKLGALADASSH